MNRDITYTAVTAMAQPYDVVGMMSQLGIQGWFVFGGQAPTVSGFHDRRARRARPGVAGVGLVEVARRYGLTATAKRITLPAGGPAATHSVAPSGLNAIPRMSPPTSWSSSIGGAAS